MLSFEQDLWQQGYQFVAGVDEAGRGPLAGPVVAAAVVFPQHLAQTWGICDSKELTHEQRAELVPIIEQNALAMGVGVVEHIDIDRLNILQATYKAMQMAIEQLAHIPEFTLVDGNGLPSLSMPCRAIIKGDSLSLSIAAASIIAKETRDRIMIDWHATFPDYGFDSHKGYATPQHIQAIRTFGFCPIHRRSFRIKELEHLYDSL